jgi:hypothetical protein
MKGLVKQMNAMQEVQKETQKELSELKRHRLCSMQIALSP